MEKYTEQQLLDMVNPWPIVRQMLEEGQPVWTSLWNELMAHYNTDLVAEYAALATKNGVWMPEDVLIYLLENQQKLQTTGLRALFQRNRFNIIDVLSLYRTKHQEERWSDKFVLAALKQPNFKELFLKFEFYLSPENEVELVKRDDFIAIINEWPYVHFWLEEKAQMELLKQPFAKLLAYVKKAKNLHVRVVDAFIDSEDFTCQKAEQLFANITDLGKVLSQDAIHKLLDKKHHAVTELVVKALPWDEAYDLENQKLLLATSAPAASIKAYARPANGPVKARVFDVSLQAEVLQILQHQAPETLRPYVNCLLTSDAEHLNTEFVAWLASQPDNFIGDLQWDREKLGTGVDFWLNTLKTSKPAVFMRAYKSATLNNGHRHNPSTEVIIKMLDCPNAPELVAIWDHEGGKHEFIPFGECRTHITYDDNRYWWNDTEAEAIVGLPDDKFQAIYGIASPSLRCKLDQHRK